MEDVSNERGHQIDKRLLVIWVEHPEEAVRLIIFEVQATLIHRWAPRCGIEALEQNSLR